MVTVIQTGYSIRTIFNYNENKVKHGLAECIGAGNYPIDVDKMSPAMKMNRFIRQAELNENIQRHSVHISINFSPEENHSKEKMMAITDLYMEKIGFGKQPYLVYQHYDAGHPHLHVVTINIERDGRRIDLYLLANRKSEPARKEIEELFGLIKADGRKKEEFALHLSKVVYGRTESLNAINTVLNVVLNQYKYASLSELNAVLQQYNIMSDRGLENSKLFSVKGLYYRILDEKGKPIGKPIKASDFSSKPTLKFLEEKFRDNETKRIPDQSRIKNSIDMALLRQGAIPIAELEKILKKDGIIMVFKKNRDHTISDTIYVDHKTKSVFNGSTLGTQYSAKGIEDRCGRKVTEEEKKEQQTEQLKTLGSLLSTAPETASITDKQQYKMFSNTERAIDAFMRLEEPTDNLPDQLTKNKKKKKRKKLSNN